MRWISFVGVLCLLGGIAHAMSIKKPTFAQLTQKSLQIIRAKVVDVQPDVSDPKLPFTWTHFRVTQVYKGSAITSLKLRLLGGVKGRYRLHIPGVPRFQIGEDVLLCVRMYPHAVGPVLVALGYGVFDFKQSPAGVTVHNRGGLSVPTRFAAFETLLKQTIAQQQPVPRRPPSLPANAH